jgi:hypothetical protein
LKCNCLSDEYEREILFLFSRMINLKELILHITIDAQRNFIDGNNISNEILIHMPRLERIIFYIQTDIKRNNLIIHLSKDDIQRSFEKLIFKEVDCIINYRYSLATCHVFSLPFMFKQLRCIGNIFPAIIFNHIKFLSVEDEIPFKHEFFVRLAWSFPSLEQLRIFNLRSQSSSSNMIIKYFHLIHLNIRDVHIDYIEQFLNDTKICLPNLTELTVDYNQLKIVTENFTKDETRFNCRNVKKLNINQTNLQSKDLFIYFPLLESSFSQINFER